MSVTLSPSMTLLQIAGLLEAMVLDGRCSPDERIYIRVQQVNGHPVADLVREPIVTHDDIPAFLRRQAD